MPRRGLFSHTLYCDEETHAAIKAGADEAGLSISKYVLGRMGLGAVGAQEPQPRRASAPKRKDPTVVGREGKEYPPNWLDMSIKERQRWMLKNRRG